MPLGQHFLHLTQTLLCLGHQLGILGPLLDQLTVFVLRTHGVRIVAVRFLHLLVVHVGDFELRLSSLGELRKESDEVLVFDFSLLVGRGCTLGVPGIAHCELRAGDKFGIRIGIDEGLQGNASDVVLALFHRIHRAVE